MLVWVPFRVLICGHSSWYPASGCDLFMCSIMVDTYWYLIRILCWFQDQFESINSTAMPDGNFNYNNILDAALKVFHLLLDLHKVQCFVSLCMNSGTSPHHYILLHGINYSVLGHLPCNNCSGGNMKQNDWITRSLFLS